MAQYQQVGKMGFIEDLAPFMAMTVEPGVSVGDFAFVSAQDVYSTTYFTPSANNTIAANQSGDLFQSAIGDGGQGLAAGNVMGLSQTNWEDSGGRLGANEVFVGTGAGFQVYKHRVVATNGQTSAGVGVQLSTPASACVLFPNNSALTQIVNGLSWQYNTGDTIARTVGPIAQWPQGRGIWGASPDLTAGTVASVYAAGPPIAVTSTLTGTVQPGLGNQNGSPWSEKRKFDVPFIFYPNVKTSIKVLSGNGLVLSSQAAVANTNLFRDGNVTLLQTATANQLYVEFLAIKMVIHGYKLTRNV